MTHEVAAFVVLVRRDVGRRFVRRHPVGELLQPGDVAFGVEGVTTEVTLAIGDVGGDVALRVLPRDDRRRVATEGLARDAIGVVIVVVDEVDLALGVGNRLEVVAGVRIARRRSARELSRRGRGDGFEIACGRVHVGDGATFPCDRSEAPGRVVIEVDVTTGLIGDAREAVLACDDADGLVDEVVGRSGDRQQARRVVGEGDRVAVEVDDRRQVAVDVVELLLAVGVSVEVGTVRVAHEGRVVTGRRRPGVAAVEGEFVTLPAAHEDVHVAVRKWA